MLRLPLGALWQMGMDATGTAQVPMALLRELAAHLRLTRSTLPPAQAFEESVRACIAAAKTSELHARNATGLSTQPSAQLGSKPSSQPGAEPGAQPSPEPCRGYRWKTLFLPDSTELPMETIGSTYYARVAGDQIMFDGRSVSPRGMTVAVAGDGRNAWRDLWLKPPGERYWKQAIRCRHEQERAAAATVAAAAASVAGAGAGAANPWVTLAPSPVDSIAAAAAAMADALRTTLTLVEHCNAQVMPKVDRRGRKYRRESDLLGEACTFD